MKKSKFLKEVENRYGFKITNIFTCEDQLENNYNIPDQLIFKWGVIPPEDFTERIVGGGYSKDLLSQIENLNDIYKLTNTGFNSHLHPSNKDKDMEEMKNLISVVLIDISGFTLSFRIDNPMIREMFGDTESILERPDFDHGMLIHRFKEHKEYLDYFFIKKRGGDWIQIWFDKSENGKQHLLHSEYLKSTKEVSCN